MCTVIGPLGGSVSVQLPHGARPRIWFGQDEVIYPNSQLNEAAGPLMESPHYKQRDLVLLSLYRLLYRVNLDSEWR